MSRKNNSAEFAQLVRKANDVDGFIDGYTARDSIMSVARLVRKTRIQRGLTQAALAELANMTQPEISRIETGLGKKGPTTESLMRLTRACNRRLYLGTSDSDSPPVAGKGFDAFIEL